MKKFKVKLKAKDRTFKVKIAKKGLIYTEQSLPDILLIYNLAKA